MSLLHHIDNDLLIYYRKINRTEKYSITHEIGKILLSKYTFLTLQFKFHLLFASRHTNVDEKAPLISFLSHSLPLNSVIVKVRILPTRSRKMRFSNET